MSTLVEIEQAIDRLPDWDVDELVGWRRAVRRSPRGPKCRAILTFWRERGGFGVIDRQARG